MPADKGVLGGEASSNSRLLEPVSIDSVSVCLCFITGYPCPLLLVSNAGGLYVSLKLWKLLS